MQIHHLGWWFRSLKLRNTAHPLEMSQADIHWFEPSKDWPQPVSIKMINEIKNMTCFVALFSESSAFRFSEVNQMLTAHSDWVLHKSENWNWFKTDTLSKCNMRECNPPPPPKEKVRKTPEGNQTSTCNDVPPIIISTGCGWKLMHTPL